MKQHKSTSKDNQLLSEMYGQIGGMTIQSTGNAEGAADQLAQDDGFNSPEEAAEGAADPVKFTLQGVGGMHGQSLVGDGESFDSLEEVCKAAGISIQDCITGDWEDISGDGNKEFQVDEDNVIVMHAAAEDGEHHNQPHPEDEASKYM